MQQDKPSTAQALEAERFRHFIVSVTDYAIYTLSPEGMVITWNAGAERFKGYREDEIVGRHFSVFYTDEERARGRPQLALEQASSSGKFEDEGWRVRKDGTRFWASVVLDPIRDDAGALLGFTKITRDITAQRQMEEQLERARESLFQSQKLEAIGKLTGGVAHDFNNLLNVVMNGLDILRTITDPAVQRRALDAMERAAQRGAALTQQLLAFARQQPLRRDPHDIARVIRSFEAVLQRAVPSRLALRLRLASELPSVLIDPTQFEAALLNLVVNARDAMDGQGEVVIAVTAVELAAGQVGQLAAGVYVRVAVVDAGTGMAPETLTRAIEPFFTTKAVGKGTGLGLSQAYGLAQQCQGDMTITSALGQGTTVALYFPAMLDAAGLPLRERADAPEKVLLVDDQPDVLETAVALFGHLGYEVLTANDGAEALAVLRAHADIAILFSDVVVPGVGGIELASIARREFPAIKVILASGYTRSSLGDGSHELDGLDLIVKPYRLSDLIKVLKTAHAA
nr:PAS domain S-box protein [uncultured Duganella sp.]